MNKNTSTTHQMIETAKAKHQKDMKSVMMYSPAWYFAQTMIARADEALKIADPAKAFKHYMG